MSAMIFPGGRSDASFWCSMNTQSSFHVPESTFLKGSIFLRGVEYLQLLLASMLA